MGLKETDIFCDLYASLLVFCMKIGGWEIRLAEDIMGVLWMVDEKSIVHYLSMIAQIRKKKGWLKNIVEFLTEKLIC